MFLKFSGQEFQIVFKRDSHESQKRKTVCSICRVREGKKVALLVGKSFCGQGDQFNKEEGRKLALKRALQKTLEVPQLGQINHRKFRTAVWKAYLSR